MAEKAGSEVYVGMLHEMRAVVPPSMVELLEMMAIGAEAQEAGRDEDAARIAVEVARAMWWNNWLETWSGVGWHYHERKRFDGAHRIGLEPTLDTIETHYAVSET